MSSTTLSQTNTAWLITDAENKFRCTEANDVNYVKCMEVLCEFKNNPHSIT